MDSLNGYLQVAGWVCVFFYLHVNKKGLGIIVSVSASTRYPLNDLYDLFGVLFYLDMAL